VVTPQGEAVLLELLKRGSRQAILSGTRLPSTFVVEGHTVHAPPTLLDPPTPMADTFIRWQEDVPAEHLYHTVHTRTARSCAFVCAFCNFPVNQGPLTLMPLDAFEQELRQLSACRSVKSLIFTDDTFNVPQKRFKELCKVLAKFDFSWYSFFRPQFADAETVELMKAAHCDAVFLGIESADDRILKNMNKAATVATFKKGIAELQKHGIRMHANFIVGFPGETEQTARKLVGFLDETGIEFFTLAPFYFVPSTPIAQRKAEFGLEGLFENWTHDTMSSVEAFALAESMRTQPKYAVHAPELAANNFWTQILLYTNGFSTSETQFLFRTYNRHLGADLASGAYRESPEYAELRGILDRHEMARPVNY
jgi:p-methyltransferase